MMVMAMSANFITIFEAPEGRALFLRAPPGCALPTVRRLLGATSYALPLSGLLEKKSYEID